MENVEIKECSYNMEVLLGKWFCSEWLRTTLLLITYSWMIPIILSPSSWHPSPSRLTELQLGIREDGPSKWSTKPSYGKCFFLWGFAIKASHETTKRRGETEHFRDYHHFSGRNTYITSLWSMNFLNFSPKALLSLPSTFELRNSSRMKRNLFIKMFYSGSTARSSHENSHIRGDWWEHRSFCRLWHQQRCFMLYAEFAQLKSLLTEKRQFTVLTLVSQSPSQQQQNKVTWLHCSSSSFHIL